MTTQEQDRTILPLNLKSIIQLLNTSGGEYAPLQYTMVQPSPGETEIHIDIQQCDPDSIQVDINETRIAVNAKATFQFQPSTNSSDSITLERDTQTQIPLAPGIALQDIHSTITSDTIIIHIPLHHPVS